MSGFEITFGLFTLLLGLAMAEVLAGYVRAFKLKSRIRHGREPGLASGSGSGAIRIGWLIPLSATVVVCHQATFWLFIFEMQEAIPLNFLSLLALLGVIGWYYLISAALWPEEPEAWPDFDEYYMAHRRFIWFGVIAIALLAEMARAAFGDYSEPAAPAWMIAVWEWANVVGSVALLALPFIRSVRWAGVLLWIVVAHFAATALVSPWTGM
ncbi:hypothetical protein [Qipengyuania sp. MTN3-11]|uniref:hypothetical protein n=1 Tax=Qipengyuania sp. MTN3-11 TaxID=3056557 RepID=UPI0036F30EFE